MNFIIFILFILYYQMLCGNQTVPNSNLIGIGIYLIFCITGTTFLFTPVEYITVLVLRNQHWNFNAGSVKPTLNNISSYILFNVLIDGIKPNVEKRKIKLKSFFLCERLEEGFCSVRKRTKRNQFPRNFIEIFLFVFGLLAAWKLLFKRYEKKRCRCEKNTIDKIMARKMPGKEKSKGGGERFPWHLTNLTSKYPQ